MLSLNTINLSAIMRDFYVLTKIRIVIFDSAFQEVMAYPDEKEGFCAMLRSDPQADEKCQLSDRAACQQCARTRFLVQYQCHAGLTETVLPILDDDKVLAYVMFGQILSQQNVSALSRLKQQHPALSHLIDRIPVKSAEELQAAATVLQAITSYVITNRWVAPKLPEFIQQLDDYIQAHLQTSITAEDVCAHFRLGRTQLYKLCKDYLGCGLAEYIRKQRIVCARKLLQETALPITQVAYAVGFSDYNHFSRIFKEQTGLSARKFRNRAER